MKKKKKRITPDGTPRFAALHLVLFCLLMSHKKDARLIRVNISMFCPNEAVLTGTHNQ